MHSGALCDGAVFESLPRVDEAHAKGRCVARRIYKAAQHSRASQTCNITNYVIIKALIARQTTSLTIYCPFRSTLGLHEGWHLRAKAGRFAREQTVISYLKHNKITSEADMLKAPPDISVSNAVPLGTPDGVL